MYYCKCLSGVPQGSVLGPLLFTLFITDLLDVIISSCKLSADDTMIYRSSLHHQTLQRDKFYFIRGNNTVMSPSLKSCILVKKKDNPGLTYHTDYLGLKLFQKMTLELFFDQYLNLAFKH